MTPEIFYCYDDANIEEAAHLMEERKIRRLPIINRGKRLVGIVSLGDLALRSKNATLTEEVRNTRHFFNAARTSRITNGFNDKFPFFVLHAVTALWDFNHVPPQTIQSGCQRGPRSISACRPDRW
jgi:hypothetical protein